MNVAVVLITRNRAEELTRTLDHLVELDEADEIVVVDNASEDGTPEVVMRRHPRVRLLRADRNLGAPARNLGVEVVSSPYVAFADDDMLWEPGSLALGAELLDRHPTVGAIAARVLVGPERREDAVCRQMATSPLTGRPGLPGPRVLGFLAGASIVRRDAYTEAGGFHRAFMIGGEEELLACDMTRAGWDVVYCADVVTWHMPSPQRNGADRRRVLSRNALWSAWLRQPAMRATRLTLRHGRVALSDPHTRAGVVDAVRGLPWVLRERRVVPPSLVAEYEVLERADGVTSSP
jgi:N-acetylglucosaminyl-diphospho-decaprenol L-rhamnosyltransferase